MISNDLLELSFKKLKEELREDLNGKNFNNDVTSNLLIDKSSNVKCVISNRENIILCGTTFIKNFLEKSFPEITVKSYFNDGIKLKKNSKIFYIYGNARIILAVERTILNFLQHLCSISTLTNKFIIKMSSKKTKLLNTRKTTAGLRKFEKYATLVGGAKNHRMGLYDKILIKDNHIKILGGIDKTLLKLSKKQINDYQIECESYSQVMKCVKMGIQYILLDNMSPSLVKKCININKKKKIKFEITGGISINNIHKYSNLGADYISTGRITNSANSVDIGLDII